MKRIAVNTSLQYEVCIGSGILQKTAGVVCQVTKAKRLCIVSDSNVWPLYGMALQTQLQQQFQVCSFVIPAGEDSKNSQNYLALLAYLADKGLDRSDCILALGGGVVGDLAGFAAATYLRGIAYIQLPTTLLAMVDSSVGGKTGIDLPGGKNLVGAFWQPRAVLCDMDTLRTLPKENLRDGCAEVIKYAILFDEALFAELEKSGMDFAPEAVIARCVELKRNVVQQDERDGGSRMKLNLGHTIGHAIEQCSNYSITHGKAVAMGMAMICRAGKCRDTDRITSLLTRFGLPITATFTAEELYTAACMDKKRSGDMVHLIIPRLIGACDIVPTPMEELKTILKEGF